MVCDSSPAETVSVVASRRIAVLDSLPMSTVTIRPATLDDAPGVYAIYAHELLTGTATWEWELPGLDTWRERMRAVMSLGFPYLVADADEAIAGYTYASSYRPRKGYTWTAENSIYVHREHHRKGIARMLMLELLARLEAGGWRQCIAVIGDSENHASIGLHASLGFERSGFFPAMGYKFGRWLDSVQMYRTLGPGASTPPATHLTVDPAHSTPTSTE